MRLYGVAHEDVATLTLRVDGNEAEDQGQRQERRRSQSTIGSVAARVTACPFDSSEATKKPNAVQ
jgi:hypothetical protein